MPRPKEYNREQVLQKAMKVFWKKGYEGTSMQDLVDATGLNRFGMYEAFKNKERLFLEVLSKYEEERTTKILAPLKGEPGGLASIKAFFVQLIEGAMHQSVPGCLMINTAIDLPARNKRAKTKIKKIIKRIEDALYECLSDARSRGEIKRKSNIIALTQYLLDVFLGMFVMMRVEADRKRLETIVGVALRNIEQNH